MGRNCGYHEKTRGSGWHDTPQLVVRKKGVHDVYKEPKQPSKPKLGSTAQGADDEQPVSKVLDGALGSNEPLSKLDAWRWLLGLIIYAPTIMHASSNAVVVGRAGVAVMF